MATDYINRASVLKLVDKGYLVSNDNPKSVKNFINCIEAADVVERKHGKWMPIIEANEFGDAYQCGCYCSECGEELQREPNFCPNCGADMRGET